jgi:hypothetical protein
MITPRGFSRVAARSNSRLCDWQVEIAHAVDAESGLIRDDDPDDTCYRLISIDTADAPEGCTGEDWFVYQIAQGANGITGYRCGSLESVSADVRSIVTSLNGRRNWPKIKSTSDRQRRANSAARRAPR